MTKHLLFLLSILGISAQAQTAGPNSPAALSNTMCTFAYSSGVGYTPAGNASASDNVYATATHCNCCDQNTQCFTLGDFGFAIPSGAVIDGIVLEVEKKRTGGGSGIVEDNGLQIMKGGLLVGPNKSQYGVDWPTTDTYVSYGSPTDLWGTTWTPADINASDFGVALASISYDCGATVVTSIDHVRMTVYYSSATGISSVSSDGSVQVFPNPVVSGSRILFNNISDINEVIITDAIGKEVFKGSSDNNSVDLPKISGGLYFYTLLSKEKKYSGKFIVD